MLYVTHWKIKEEHLEEAVARFSNAPPEIPAGVKMIGRWHAMGTGEGFSLMESDDPVAISSYVYAWADLVEQRVFPVIDDEGISKAMGLG
ncbi:MAG: DUF3303 domain-containing protein [marine benthic group bacterium]|jgi:hypothetical protein|nr:DUF3303 domain-containing protein [Gemmatimonadota bacterium]MCL7967382.1 DUF3303 domain-containing protein [Gemmatimonadota bacterium]MCL7968717.1 DUF3303 domain-containing protein [Gemmatimonadota bacterium]MCL7973533.1 DUF3303 domain-containing protein [Gemmatimonadota bacterium]MCL7977597.1 DUF3303 domain-containing protein [Gemmatimonadota bacterium]